jgi:hypothetical protein
MTQNFEKYSNFMKIRLVWAELFQEDGQADMTKLTVAFRSFVNASKSGKKTTTNWGPDSFGQICELGLPFWQNADRQEQESDEATAGHGLQGSSVTC